MARELPQDAQQLPPGAQNAFRAAFESAISDGISEQGAQDVAWNSVRQQYVQDNDGQWKPHDEVKDARSPYTQAAVQSGGN